MPSETGAGRPLDSQTEPVVNSRVSNRRFVATIAAVLSVIYLPTAGYGFDYHPDPLTNVFTAWSVANQGTVYLDPWDDVTGPPFFGAANQIITSKGRPVSKYPPGSALTAAPLYLAFPTVSQKTARFTSEEGTLAARFNQPSLVPAAIAASVSTAMGVAALAAVVRRRLGHRNAVLFAGAVGLGTGYWSVAADSLWQHGPLAMWSGFGILALDRDRPGLAGAAFGVAVLTRPQFAVAIAVLGTGVAWSRRSWKSVLWLGSVSTLGPLAYALFNLALFDHPLPIAAGGYFVANSIEASGGFFLTNILQTLFNPDRGLLLLSPVAIVAIPGLAGAWRRADPLIRSLAIGGVGLMLLQLRGNVWDGGDAFFGYRYALEMVFLTAPLAATSIHDWVAGNIFRTRVAWGAGMASVLIHAIGSVSY